MSRVRIIVSMALTAVASASVATGIQVGITDAVGGNHTQTVQAADFPAPESDGTFVVEVDFLDIGTGDFAGDVVALAAGGTVGDPVHFTGTATNLQPIPVSVAVAFS